MRQAPQCGNLKLSDKAKGEKRLINWTTLIISTAISLLLSLMTFSLGLRAGKERTDRKALREKYRKLSVHFSDIFKGIQENNPKMWSDYERIQTVDSIQYYPLAKKMKKEGEDLELDINLFNHLIELETDALQYGHHFKELELKIEKQFRKHLLETDIEFIEEFENLVSRKNEIGKPYRVITYKYSSFLSKERIDSMVKLIQSNETGMQFEIYKKTRHGMGLVSVYIHQNDIQKINLESIILKLHEETKDFSTQLLANKISIMKNIEIPLSLLEQRTKEPYSFWDTIKNTIKDFAR